MVCDKSAESAHRQDPHVTTCHDAIDQSQVTWAPCVFKLVYLAFSNLFKLVHSFLAIIIKYGVPINKWDALYYALLEVSMNKIALWNKDCTWHRRGPWWLRNIYIKLQPIPAPGKCLLCNDDRGPRLNKYDHQSIPVGCIFPVYKPYILQ